MQEEIESCERLIKERAAQLPPDANRPELLVLPIYAALPPEQQLRVFQPPPEGTRKASEHELSPSLAGRAGLPGRCGAHCNSTLVKPLLLQLC